MDLKLFRLYQKAVSPDDENYLEDSMTFINDSLVKLGMSGRQIVKAELMAEETIEGFRDHSAEGARLIIVVRRSLGSAYVVLRMKGEAYEPCLYDEDSLDSVKDDQSAEAIRSILLGVYRDSYKYTNKSGTNKAIITVERSEQAIRATILALILGLLVGIIGNTLLPAPLTNALCNVILDPIKTMFMNALQIIIAPVVFLSLLTCISQYSNIAELGKLGAKVMGLYLLTTTIAIILAMVVSSVLQPGEPGFALAGASVNAASVSVDTNVDTSLLHTIINIIPSNLLAPFLESNTLQLIFLAVVCGIALGAIGEYSGMLKEIFEALYSMFMTITTMIARFIPLAVFCSVALLAIQLDKSSLISVLGILLVFIFTIFLMIGIYGLLIMLMGKLNPVIFFKKIWEGMLTSFSLCSSSAAMPTNMRICNEKLGISPKLTSFSIPLGATVNMDGACINLMICGLFLARAYNVPVSRTDLVSAAITIILLSLGAPGVPGAGLVCLGVVLEALHVPVEAIGLIIAVNPIMDMFSTMSNTTGDMTVSLITARSEGLFDREVYLNENAGAVEKM